MESQSTVSGLYRREFIAAGGLAMFALAGCLGRGSRVAAGTAIQVDDLLINVLRVDVTDELVADEQSITARPGSVIALPWIRIENTGSSPASLPAPIGRVRVMHGDERVRYITGTIDEITIDGETSPSYRSGYRAVDGSLPAGEVVEGYGPIFEFAEGFDPAEVGVKITVNSRDYEWWLETEE